MRLRANITFCLLFLLVHQTPQDTIRQHYKLAEAARQAGDLDTAESEYFAILGEGYQRLEGGPKPANLELPRKSV